MSTAFSRRSLLSGRWCGLKEIRPPQTVDETLFLQKCSRCDACLQVCETQVIVKGQGGFPALDFNQAECTFCGRCADICPESLFNRFLPLKGRDRVKIDENCLALNNIICRSCEDNCEYQAIKFQLRTGGCAVPQIQINACSGCGACIRHCPAQAIILYAHQADIYP